MTPPVFDIAPFLSMPEGQHFERKSLFEGEPGKKQPRDRKTVRDEIADCVAGFANAEGGVVVFGIEDDGGEFATDGGEFAPDGGEFASNGGEFARGNAEPST